MYRDGKWVDFETTVCWLERDPATGFATVEREATFSSIPEREAHIKQVIDGGRMFDIKWTTESSYGGEPGPNDEKIRKFIEGLR